MVGVVVMVVYVCGRGTTGDNWVMACVCGCGSSHCWMVMCIVVTVVVVGWWCVCMYVIG